ncbi:transporter [Rhizobium sp. TH2]|jgi:multidrug transporter EmrE-like cation transporter|uniref:transporter n=1 Tax=Rhizobium sp. TH2 TaxID=2775403 RepID=UPI0021580334|nr:transporter [Rhizobium sp. TH2]UVC09038.1 transporter [Rhizobium sp. TH2]
MFSLPVPIWIGLLGTPFLIAAGQVLFKLTSATTGGLNANGLAGLLLNPLFIAALALYAFGTIVWIFVLKQVPLTIAYSFMGLTFCFVPLLAQLFLGEALTLRYFLGVALIIGGMVAINS